MKKLVTRTRLKAPAAPVWAELEDREAIRSLIHTMNWLADEGRIDELLDCFVDDLIYDVSQFGIFHGKPELKGFYNETVMPFSMRIHHTTNQLIDVFGNQAVSRSYWRAELILNGRALVSSGHYLDDLRKKGNSWKVWRRKATITYMCPLEEGWAKTRMMNWDKE